MEEKIAKFKVLKEEYDRQVKLKSRYSDWFSRRAFDERIRAIIKKIDSLIWGGK